MTREDFWQMVDEFNMNTDNITECWEWPHGRNKGGYACVYLEGKTQYAYRVVCLEEGENGIAMHICDNPGCFNPWHVQKGTHKKNTADMIAKGRSQLNKKSFDNPDAVCYTIWNQ